MALTERDKLQLADEKLDPRKLYPCCPIHNYYGPVSFDPMNTARIVPVHQRPDPAIGCSACWKVYYLVDIAQVAPSERAQRLEEIEEVLRNLNDAVEKNKFDFRINRRPVIEVEKDAHPD